MKLLSLGGVLIVASLSGALFAGLVVAKEIKDRQALIAAFEVHAVSHPEDAGITAVLVGCNKQLALRVDVDSCSATLLQKFGPEVMDRLAAMAEAGAFTPVH